MQLRYSIRTHYERAVCVQRRIWFDLVRFVAPMRGYMQVERTFWTGRASRVPLQRGSSATARSAGAGRLRNGSSDFSRQARFWRLTGYGK